ncbi:MAG: hypothetical protein EA392_13795 [Cryomorphaceae bacterium]|nr:MAG: hypothetical protein EA392_13795 [Cryomorphaceae bacterium]
MCFRHFLGFTLALFFSFQAQSQKDSLLNVWNDTTLPDSLRLNAAHNLVWRVYLRQAPDTARYYAEAQLELAQKLGLKRQVSSAYNSIGVTHHMQGDLEKAVENYELSLGVDIERARATPKDANTMIGIATSQSNVGIIYQQLGNIPLALVNYKSALHLLDSLEKTGQDVNLKIAALQNSLGLANENQQSLREAQKWYLLAIERYEKEKQGSELANSLSNLGNVTIRFSDFSKGDQRDSLLAEGMELHDKALKIRRKIKDKKGEANALNNMGALAMKKGNSSDNSDDQQALYKSAEDYFLQAAELAEEVQDRVELSGIYANLAEVYFRQQRDYEAMEIARKALELSSEIGQAEFMMRASEKLYSILKRLGNPEAALEMYEMYNTLADSIRNEENTRALMQQQYEHEFAQKESALIFEQEKQNALAAAELRRKNLERNAFIGGFGLMLLLAVVFFSQRQRIAREKQRSEELLLNILPEETAQELKEKGSAEAQLIESVTVLFTDFKGFTQLSEVLTPKELVKDLHECFSAFDHILEKHGIEKIKTIGDAYMAAGGLPTPTNDHAVKVIRAALEMRDFVEEGKQRKIANNLPYFEIRIGIHTGPVVAGIVGVKKFQYDIWGDTVNTASRMESSGEVGKVNISEATYELVKDEFNCELRGEIEAKGKGKMRMLFVESRK